ncbi:MAG: hypothetical protein ABIN58_00865, partial [candidate division WOR-3 bacterium]
TGTRDHGQTLAGKGVERGKPTSSREQNRRRTLLPVEERMKLNITRLAHRTPPVISFQRAGGWVDYSLASPWWLESQLEPAFWGQPDTLMLSGNYIDPVRGFRFRARLTTQAIDLNDMGILNELRRASRVFRFYPWGKERPFWDVYITSSMYHIRKNSPRTSPADLELLGTKILSQDETKSIGIILEPSARFSGNGPYEITATWFPVITVGEIKVRVRDALGNADEVGTPVSEGRLRFTTANLVSEPTRAVFSHDMTPYEKEVIL